ncbi:MAG: class IV adenylate cyclase [Patescibacteria group bacterium]|nr:class IV adenylate cyclase [Patescibacteria group bacterium]MDD4304295.1 class IV adenylate cyclase [Patescibacteria group bacterium]MDD4695678.1 class IV adenylate cyclase [Patescibacteria group bacterium]
MKHTNIEIKAKCINQDKIRDILKSYDAKFIGTDHQIDTYFKVSKGRLKLREGNIENHLIFYEREDKSGPKQSNVTFCEFQKDSGLKKVLEKSLGVLVVVDKQREIYFIDNVKFHLDTVSGLGTFVEIEAIDGDDGIVGENLLEQCNKYLEILGIKESDLLDSSYSDQILEKLNNFLN